MKSAKLLLAGGLALAGSLGVADALACGAPFGPGMSVDPHQDIIIAHKGGVETYVFQPTFCGDAKDFGLVLPVPALLSSSPALGDAKAFEQVIALSQPTVNKVTRCVDRGNGDAGVGGYGDGGDGTSVVASGRVGFLEWVQLEATDQASFTAWLDANGYPYDAAAKSAFDYYVGKHWYFLAFKVAQGVTHVAGTCTALGPISLTFPSAKPVVPSRMATGGATVPQPGYPSYSAGFTWRIFGITSPGRQVDFVWHTYRSRTSFSGALAAGDLTNLGGLAQPGDRLTKLQVWFDGTSTEDAELTLAPDVDYREVVEDVTYVDCGDGGAPDDAAPVGDGGSGGGGDGGGLGAAPSVGGGSCSSSSSGARGGLFGFGVAVALGLAARARRRRRPKGGVREAEE